MTKIQTNTIKLFITVIFCAGALFFLDFSVAQAASCRISPSPINAKVGQAKSFSVYPSPKINHSTYKHYYLNGKRYYTHRGGCSNFTRCDSGLSSSQLKKAGNYTLMVSFDRANYGYAYACQTTVKVADDPPTATLRVRNKTDGGSWTGSNITIDYGDQISLNWSSARATKCVGSYFSTSNKTGGTQNSVSEPSVGGSKTYRVTCYGSGGSKTDTIKVTRRNNLPTATLRVRNSSTGTSWTGSNITIDYNDQIQLNWSSSNATKCTASGSSFSTGNATGGTDTSIGEPVAGSSRTYSVTCTGPGGSRSDSLTVTRTDPPPTATLQVRNTTTGTSWTGSNITIEPTEQIALNWSSTNSNTCSGTNFSTGNSTGGTQNSVTEANPGANKTYTVGCVGDGGSSSDSLVVTTNSLDEVSLEVDSPYVRSGDTVELSWDIGNNDSSSCTITGPNVSGSLASYTSPHTVSINGESSFTINCPGGSDTATVRILPTIEETF